MGPRVWPSLILKMSSSLGQRAKRFRVASRRAFRCERLRSSPRRCAVWELGRRFQSELFNNFEVCVCFPWQEVAKAKKQKSCRYVCFFVLIFLKQKETLDTIPGCQSHTLGFSGDHFGIFLTAGFHDLALHLTTQLEHREWRHLSKVSRTTEEDIYK